MVVLDITVQEAWEQINGLLGKKVITTVHPNWQEPNILKIVGIESYILTPEEVVSSLFSLQTGPERYANPDPTRKEAIEILLNPEKFNSFYSYNNQPLYWIARAVKFRDEEVQVWIDHAALVKNRIIHSNNYPPTLIPPIHLLGKRDNIPIVYYSYGIHSNSMSYGCKNKPVLLNRMKEAGLTIPA